MPKKIVTSNTLEPGDKDITTPRYIRDPAAHGTGFKGRLILVRRIRMPNDPAYAKAYGEGYSLLDWCDECKWYEHTEYRECQRGGIDPDGNGSI